MISRILVVIALVCCVSIASHAHAQNHAARAVPSSIPTVALDGVARHGFFYAGGKYVGELGPEKESTMGGAMYVEVMVPRQMRSPYPIVFLHGAGQTGVDWLQTPDGRPGWAYNFLDMGYVVYLQDFPARGRSQYVPGVDGTPGQLNLNIRTAPNLEETFTAMAARGNFPQAKKHTQWPGSGRMGDKVFDDFTKTQVQFLAGGRQETLTRDANVALLDMINTPVILLTHSQGGAFGWLVADARPNLVKAIVTLEPAAPPIRGVDNAKVAYTARRRPELGRCQQPDHLRAGGRRTRRSCSTVLEEAAPAPDKVPCYVQQEPARKLKNLQNIPVLFMVGEGELSPHLRSLPGEVAQSGRREDRVRRDGEGRAARQRAHDDAREEQRRHREVHRQLAEQERRGRRSGEHVSKAMPPKTIPTFSTESIARKGFFFAGGSYWGEAGRQVMRGAMYTEVWVPRQVRSSEPDRALPRQRADRRATGSRRRMAGRAGRIAWSKQGYVVYMVDYPARGRSAYVPLPGPDGKTPIDGNLSIRTALELERIWTNARERGDFPLKMNHTQWPGAGKIGDPIFDNFMKIAGAVRRREHGAGA